jgi:hypothetical protein
MPNRYVPEIENTLGGVTDHIRNLMSRDARFWNEKTETTTSSKNSKE